MFRGHFGKSLAFLLLIAPSSSLATGPLVVRNTDKPLWDSTHRIEFKENLRIGGDEDNSEVFGQTVSIAADSKGRIITADYSQNQVRRYGADGRLLGTIGRGGEGPGEYRLIRTVATDSQDNVYVGGQGRVSVFDANGTFLHEFKDESHSLAHDIRAMPDGSILLSAFDEASGTALQKYVDGKCVARFCDGHQFSDDIAHEMLGFRGGSADVGRDGMIYYTQMVPYEIRKFTSTGELVMKVFRENDFVKPPRIEHSAGWTRLYPFCGSYGIFVLPDGRFLNIAPMPGDESSPAVTVFDLFDKDGRLLLTQSEPLTPQWLDSGGNVYAFAGDASAVVRARMTLH